MNGNKKTKAIDLWVRYEDEKGDRYLMPIKPFQLKEIIQVMVIDKLEVKTYREIAEELELSLATVYRYSKKPVCSILNTKLENG